ncbi:phosphatidylinositol-3,5-bisphosphate 3-phosphatase MTMR14 [Onthophagus taurus]|uniref:phosphatidylinositol-3,5-bisphosphate 3-phosphatase MTMR14 n=1 Tax=Onthophagus taurus TaxID=166361 RepID=UPI000C20D192|nr:myotubularin-related protein 14 [Onthophagus taurus]
MSGDVLNSECVERISMKDVEDLLDYFSKNGYKSNSTDAVPIACMSNTIGLMKLDYTLFTIKNSNPELCNHYPSELIFLESPKNDNPTIYENLYNSEQLKSLITNSRYARCRARFPMPVIMYKGKYLLRSSTLAGPLELNARHIYDTIKSVFGYEVKHITDMDIYRLRSLDVELLESYNVMNIVDLMVEKKKIKYNVSVTSSEKVTEEYGHYGHFNLLSLPYPGCEFFSEFRLNNYEAEDLQFDWEQPFIDAELVPPQQDGPLAQLNIRWENYRKWNLVEMTQNYLKVLLKYMHERKDSTLIHCISGWDRTPMFVSLVRISMWADGVIHHSLSPLEMLYLTVAYDWFLFGHDLPNRRSKNEEIFYFCFYMLKHIEDEEFCINPNYIKNKQLLNRASDHAENKEKFDTVDSKDQLGSSLSLNSNASSVSVRSQERNASPNESLSDDFEHLSVPDVCKEENRFQTRGTSPVNMPAIKRTRTDSMSSTNSGTWAIISGTGSLRSSDLNSEKSWSTEHCRNVGEEFKLETRVRKLRELRRLMQNAYGKTIGLKFVN